MAGKKEKPAPQETSRVTPRKAPTALSPEGASLAVMEILIRTQIGLICNVYERQDLKLAKPEWKKIPVDAMSIPRTTALQDLGLGQMDIVCCIVEIEDHVKRVLGKQVNCIDDDVGVTDTLMSFAHKMHAWFAAKIPTAQLQHLSTEFLPLPPSKK